MARPQAGVEADGRAPMRSPTPVRLGRFSVLECLGREPLGSTYAAYDPELDRRVALRVFDGELANRFGVVRLRAEATAFAKVEHPQLLAVHEVGVHDGCVFVTVEYAPGGSLADLPLPETNDPARAHLLLPHLLDSVAALQAIHDSGLVHGGFTTQSVLIGADGRSRIADLGRAQIVASLQEARPLDSDVLSDQRDCCAAFFELVYARPPTTSAHELNLHGLAATLQRGMDVDPAQRFESMRQLGTALRLATQARHRTHALWVAGGLVAATTAYVALQDEPAVPPPPPDSTCVGHALELAAVWDPNRRAAVEAAFVATGQKAAPGVWDRVGQRLDAWTDAWGAAALSSCEATRVHNTQTQRMFELRAMCQRRQLDALEELVSEYLEATPTSVFTATRKAIQLPKIEHCIDPERLVFAGGALDFSSPVIQECYALTDQAKELSMQARYAEAELYQREAALLAAENGALAMASWVYQNLAMITLQLGEWDEAELCARRQLEYAEKAGDGSAIVSAWIRLAQVVDEKTRSDDVDFFLAQATAAADGFDVPEILKAELLMVRARRTFVRGDAAEGARLALEGVALHEALGTDPIRVAVGLSAAARALSAAGQTEQSTALYRRSIVLHEEIFGPVHPKTLHVEAGLARNLVETDPREALALSTFVYENTPTDIMFGTRYLNAGWHATILRGNDLEDEAAAVYQRQAADAAQHVGPDAPRTLQARTNYADTLGARDRWREAVEEYEAIVEALATAERVNPNVQATAHVGYGRALAKVERPAEAIAVIETGVALLDRAGGPNQAAWTELLIVAGETLESVGVGARAVPLYARAVKLAETAAITPELREQLRSHLPPSDGNEGPSGE